MSRASENYVFLPGSSSAVEDESQEGLGNGIQWRAWSVVSLVTTCCIAAILFASAAFVSYNSRLKAEDDLVESSAGLNGIGEFYTASRTRFHFQPEKNFMGDPCASIFYKGYYHFFFQYNPKGTQWNSTYWGHAVSRDLIHWMYLDMMLSPDHWYDEFGAWSGSATILRDGTPVIFYTGGRDEWGGWSSQSQNLAWPVDPTDPLLREWKKYDFNPILYNPPFVSALEYRDPSTGWLEDDGLWRMTMGSSRYPGEDGNGVEGIAMMYTSTDFIHWKLEETLLHAVPGTKLWECVDLYPVFVEGEGGLDHTVLRAEHYVEDQYKYVLKVSLNKRWQDAYVVGTYSTESHTFTPDDPVLDIGTGLLYDYGKFYGSRTFYDTNTGRRILWGYANESDSESDRDIKGWACVQAIPRTIWLDPATQKHVLQWPVKEVEALRGAKSSHQNIELQPRDVVKVGGGDGPLLDILVVFEKPDVSSVENVIPDPTHFDCTQRGSADRGVFGPFGLLLHTDEHLVEQTAVYFYISLLEQGKWVTAVCSDQSRSTLAPEVDLTNFGNTNLTILPTENELSLRILLDHSIVETFVQGGRMAITTRIYPTIAIGSKSHTFLFNNGTTPIQVKSLDVYQMGKVNMTSFSDSGEFETSRLRSIASIGH